MKLKKGLKIMLCQLLAEKKDLKKKQNSVRFLFFFFSTLSDFRLQNSIYLLLAHLGKLIQKSEVLSQVFAVRLDAVLHDREEGLNKASDTGPAADILHWPIHVVRAEQTQEQRF